MGSDSSQHSSGKRSHKALRKRGLSPLPLSAQRWGLKPQKVQQAQGVTRGCQWFLCSMCATLFYAELEFKKIRDRMELVIQFHTVSLLAHLGTTTDATEIQRTIGNGSHLLFLWTMRKQACAWIREPCCLFSPEIKMGSFNMISTCFSAISV